MATRVGISGWTFPGWKGRFYPKELKAREELSYASRRLGSIEINGTFYSLQRPGTFQSWASQVPEDFQFSVKAPQFITHVLRLKDCEEPLANFFASGLLCLGKKLGPILWQFPPFVTLKDDRFEKFLAMLPRTSEAAARLAKRHGAKVEGRSWTRVDEDFPVRHAFEMRHPSFATPDFLSLLEEHGAAFVVAHGAEKGPYVEEVTSDFMYLRLHGEGAKYEKGYPAKELVKLAARVRRWAGGGEPPDAKSIRGKRPARRARDVFVYFSNEAKEFSPGGALKLQSLLKVGRRAAARKRAA